MLPINSKATTLSITEKRQTHLKNESDDYFPPPVVVPMVSQTTSIPIISASIIGDAMYRESRKSRLTNNPPATTTIGGSCYTKIIIDDTVCTIRLRIWVLIVFRFTRFVRK